MSIKSIAEFISELKNIPKSKTSELYFRGHSDIDYKLIPGIYRNVKLINNEHNLFKEFLLRTPSDFLNDKSALEKLAKMQHYGLPTRLLDITTNPLVALYFACSEKGKKDGKVIVFRIPKNDIKYYDSDTASIISNIAKRPSKFEINSIKGLNLKEFNAQGEIAYLLHEIREEKSYFQSIINEQDIERVIAIKVKQNNNRIIKQSGAFLLFGINGKKNLPAEIPSNWTLNLDSKGVDFKIDNDSKDNIIEELNVLGINEATLFPELDNQAKYLKKHYG
ncbi:FRG domain-containing protein [Myroides odoratimimus]|uniref:FRG domain-containing protein n=1 Tax=Myroides odoratimimus TaxID=76832 RepID=UPI0025757B5A|nr:FRG domain-containing protein [Myroides odoratimimus]MDM1521332.1 FRG domain-containing protein [Myroides odoratimimus]